MVPNPKVMMVVAWLSNILDFMSSLFIRAGKSLKTFSPVKLFWGYIGILALCYGFGVYLWHVYKELNGMEAAYQPQNHTERLLSDLASFCKPSYGYALTCF